VCGIAGYAALDPLQPLDPAAVGPMLHCIRHRGPDDQGVHSEPGIVLGHRRLSVIDLVTGHQPLYGRRDTTSIIVNGEIYNYRELREQLVATGSIFRSQSDSEVIAHAYDAWGLDFLDRLDGMFALALWDGAQRRLILARDRMGEKPLYWCVANGLLLFASELTALRAHPAAPRELDLHALTQYLALEYVPAPRTIIAGINKLTPGEALVLENGAYRTFAFWLLKPHVRTNLKYADAVAELRHRLDEAVKSRLVSDVPLGVFLSGGIDSSAVAALAARQGALETFSIGFTEASFDESTHARKVAQHIGSHHHERILTGDEMPSLVPRLPTLLDEPLGDASIIPTALLSGFARERVTVALGGDGGDELFAGYPMHQAHRVAWAARALRPTYGVARAMLRSLPVSHKNFAFAFKGLSFLRGAGEPPPRNHALWMSSFSPDEQRTLLTDGVLDALGPAFDPLAPIASAWDLSVGSPLLARATHLDAVTWLPNDILMKVDRASMSVALEARAPFLARDVVELAFSVPDAFRMKGLTGKRMLRDAVRDLLPPEILQRPKKGFGIPVAAWLNGPLRKLADELLAPAALPVDLFRPEPVRKMLRDHRAGAMDYRKPLWTLLVFSLWYQHHRALTHLTRSTAGVA